MQATFRFLSSLNDFLPQPLRGTVIPYTFRGRVSVKHAVEALGVPHVEVEHILANGSAVSFSYLIEDEDRIELLPALNAPEIGDPVELRTPLPRPLRFMVDGHLGQLAVYLRLLGIDASYENDMPDEQIAAAAGEQERVLLTRDVRLLMRKNIVHGYWLRAKEPKIQIREVLDRYSLRQEITPWRRCLRCNGMLESVDKEAIKDRLEPLTKIYYHEFHICQECQRIYWKGSHYRPLRDFVADILGKEARDDEGLG